MIFDNLGHINTTEIPVVIFGSGPAGISVALELEKKNINSLIIEAGDEEYSLESQDLYRGEIIGDNITDLHISRLRQFGGSSGHWGGWCRPREDYNYLDWPISKNELSKFHNRTCEILEIENNFRQSSLNEYFNQIEFKTSQISFSRKYKKHISNSNKITLVLNTTLSHFVGNGQNTSGAICISNSKFINVNAKFYVLACGGIENSRVLLWTQRQNNNFISKELAIGQYWMNHPYILSGSGAVKKKALQKKMKNNFINFTKDSNIHFGTKFKIIKEKDVLSANIFMKSNEDLKLYKELLRDLLCVVPEYGNKLIRKFLKKDLMCGNIYMQLEEETNLNNKIILSNKKDKFGIPLVKLFYKKTQKSLYSAKIIMEEFANMCREEELGRISIKENIYNLEDFENLGAFHHLGGTRMGTEKFNSVVDKNLKVHNINNLYVTGSSTFTTGGFSNPTFTIIQLSLRLANELSKFIKV